MIDFEFAPDGSDKAAPKLPTVDPENAASLKNLNDRQREAVLITEGPLIVLAGAGSGKTKMLTSRISYLIEVKGVPPHNILAMTFTNKAAGEMRERVEKILNLAAGQLSSRWGSYLGIPEIGTFHSVCVRLLRREMNKTPFTKQFVIYDDSDQLSLIKTGMDKLGIDDKAFNPKAFQAGINRLKCDAIEPHELHPDQHNLFERQLKNVYEQYQKDLFSNNALDFGEIICMTYRILRDHEDVRAKYQKRFNYIHVDEYQDTNRAQYQLLMTLSSEQFSGHKNICVVGDEDQSIYKWRGADIRNILDFEKDFPGAQVVKLEQNYRSTQTIIKAAGDVIRHNRSRKDKTLWTENAEGSLIVRAQLPDERAEAELVVREIKRLAGNEDRAFADFSIFYRTNAQSRQFEDVLRREKIPYQIVGGLRFYDRKEIKDVLSYLKVILNPADSVSLKRIINVPARGIGKTTIDKLEDHHAKQAPDQTLWEVLNLATQDAGITSAATAKKLAVFTKLMARFMNEQPKLLMSELYHLILDETGYVRDLRAEATEEALDRVENLEELDTVFKEFEEDFLESVPEVEHETRKAELLPLFIEQSALVSEADSLDGIASTVKMMTLHSSKGLEFPVVFLVGMEEGLFPSIKQWEEETEEDVEEERRLCYVGMTRAREQLYLTHVVIRRIWGNVSYQEPARFFAEMPENLIEFKDFSRVVQQSQSGFSSARSSGNPTPSRWQTSAQSEVIGRKLRHPEYGTGTVVASDGSGEDQKITIEFRGREQRKFLLRYVASYFE